MRALHLSLLTASLVLSSLNAVAATWPFTGQLEIQTSVGREPTAGLLFSVSLSGTAEIEGGVVRIPAGAISIPVPSAFGFDGTLRNGPGTFSPGGAGAGATCPLIDTQEVCVDGGGFGGAMALNGMAQLGQDLERFGLPGTNLGMTASGLQRREGGTHWTDGQASAWYFIY
jgi:hypothetical protein